MWFTEGKNHGAQGGFRGPERDGRQSGRRGADHGVHRRPPAFGPRRAQGRRLSLRGGAGRYLSVSKSTVSGTKVLNLICNMERIVLNGKKNMSTLILYRPSIFYRSDCHLQRAMQRTTLCLQSSKLGNATTGKPNQHKNSLFF